MKALIIVDVQNDFCPGGALAVAGGDEVVPVINRLMQHFDLVVATQDWHPAEHGSFAANHPGHAVGEIINFNGLQQVLWPVHCVQDSVGAALHPDLDLAAIAQVFQKGTDSGVDSYSGFFDNGHRRATGLAQFLREAGVIELCVVGLATDYCVKYTALDARHLGFATTVIEDACRGVNLAPDHVEKALAELQAAGVRVTNSRGL